jgi:hypothetical protein
MTSFCLFPALAPPALSLPTPPPLTPFFSNIPVEQTINRGPVRKATRTHHNRRMCKQDDGKPLTKITGEPERHHCSGLRLTLRERTEHLVQASICFGGRVHVCCSHRLRISIETPIRLRQYNNQRYIFKLRSHSETYFIASPSSTARFFSKSILFPAITITMSFPTIFRNSLTQFLTLWNDSASVMSYTRSAPAASR